MPNIGFEENKLVRFTWDPYFGEKVIKVFDELYEEYMGEDAFYDSNIDVQEGGIHDLNLNCIKKIILRSIEKCGITVPKNVQIDKDDLKYYRNMINTHYH